MHQRTVRTLVSISALALAASLVAGCGTDFTPEEHVARALEYSAKGDVRAASIELKAALQQAPDNSEARFQLGLLHLKVGDGAGAEKELRRAMDLGKSTVASAIPLTRAQLLQHKFEAVLEAQIQEIVAGDNVETRSTAEQAELLALRGHAYYGTRQLDPAERQYDAALTVTAEAPEALYGKARIAAARRDTSGVNSWLEKALAVNKKFAAAWELKGLLAAYQGDAKASLEAYTQAIESGTFDASAWLNRALARIALKDHAGAQRDIAVVEKRVKKTPGAAYALGLIAYDSGEYAVAYDRFQDALRNDQDYAPAIFYLGVTSAVLEKIEQAETQLARFVSMYPDDDLAAKLLAGIRARLGDVDGSRQLLEGVIARNPADATALEFLGRLAMREGRADDGVQFFQRVVAQQADQPAAHLQLGLAMMSAGSEKRGIEAIQQAIELNPDARNMQYVLFDRYYSKGNYDDAIELANKLRAEHPEDPLPTFLLGVVSLARQDEPRARQFYQESLEVKPGFAPAIRDLARIENNAGARDEAAKWYQEGLKHNPEDQHLLLEAAALAASVGNEDESRSYLERAMKAHPNDLAPRLLLARYYSQSGLPERALALLTPVEARFADNPGYLVEKGLALLGGNQSSQAQASFESLIKLTPRDAAAHELLARALIQARDLPRARQELEQALSLEPDHLMANLAYLRLLIAQGQLKSADKALVEIFRREPNGPAIIAEFRLVEAELALAARDPARASRAATDAHARVPSTRTVVQLAQAQLAGGDRNGARQTLEDWNSRNPKDQALLQAMGKLYEDMNEVDLAFATYERLLELNPDNLLALNNGAWLMHNREPKKAKALIDRALKIAPRAAEILDTAGATYLATGDAKRAVELLDEAVQAVPGNHSVRFHFVQALTSAGDNERAARELARVMAAGTDYPERPEALALAEKLGVKVSAEH